LALDKIKTGENSNVNFTTEANTSLKNIAEKPAAGGTIITSAGKTLDGTIVYGFEFNKTNNNSELKVENTQDLYLRSSYLAICETLKFETDKSGLDNITNLGSVDKMMNDIVKYLRDGKEINITGITSTTGSEDHNLILSNERAKTTFEIIKKELPNYVANKGELKSFLKNLNFTLSSKGENSEFLVEKTADNVENDSNRAAIVCAKEIADKDRRIVKLHDAELTYNLYSDSRVKNGITCPEPKSKIVITPDDSNEPIQINIKSGDPKNFSFGINSESNFINYRINGNQLYLFDGGELVAKVQYNNAIDPKDIKINVSDEMGNEKNKEIKERTNEMSKFYSADTNKDNIISNTEVQNLTDFIKKVDLNNDGLLSAKEIKDGYKVKELNNMYKAITGKEEIGDKEFRYIESQVKLFQDLAKSFALTGIELKELTLDNYLDKNKYITNNADKSAGNEKVRT
jgi:outer membrane protein OmpA-like peptidoglycan-associated protein